MTQTNKILDCGIFNEVTFLNEGIVDRISPLRKYLSKLKHIKNQTPTEFDGPDEVKKFIDKNYDDIIKAAELIQEEPENISKAQLGFLAAFAISAIGMICMPTSSVIGFMMPFLLIIIMGIISILRTTEDEKALMYLTKINNSLKRINTSKLSDDVKRKISKITKEVDSSVVDARHV